LAPAAAVAVSGTPGSGGAMRPLTFEKLSNELAAAAANAMPDWWERIDSDPKWRSYSECVA
jgi:hypothetical protein